MGFLSHSFVSRYDSKPIKDFKDTDYRLVSKKILSQNMVCWIGTQGQVYLAKKAKTCPHCDVTHREPQIRNEKKIFKSELEDLRNPLWVWIPL